uniref:endo-polygalacturonase n=1 Tax=Globisporangium ultimum (strain ATCC 200006 / CBS 805.95 / DAOM BR144) TaxID=431595 RepID=K3W7T9_GLOUD
MKFNLSSLFVALLVSATRASSMTSQQASSTCTLTGTYVDSTSINSPTCNNILISNLNVPKHTTLDLTKVPAGATITFAGTTTFGITETDWQGPLVLLTGKNLKVKGSGVLDGQGNWYWQQFKTNPNFQRPVFFRLLNVHSSTLSGFTLKNSPFRTFSIVGSTDTVLDHLTLDSKAGDNLAKNTDGFDMSSNNGVNITNNIILNQDDCLAMQSSTNTHFIGNTCTGGHGISVGSIGGTAVDSTDTVSGLVVQNNKIINSDNGIRIKTIVGSQGLVTGVTYISNTLTNVKNAIVMHSDYNKSAGGYTGKATSAVAIKDITIAGLSGTATNLYDVLVNPSVVSGWKWSGITVAATAKGSCSGQPSTVTCA